MREGDILGHEFMGEVVEIDPRSALVRGGAPRGGPFAIACGSCCFAGAAVFSLC